MRCAVLTGPQHTPRGGGGIVNDIHHKGKPRYLLCTTSDALPRYILCAAPYTPRYLLRATFYTPAMASRHALRVSGTDVGYGAIQEMSWMRAVTCITVWPRRPGSGWSTRAL